jgi:hypothetical protein
MAAFSSSDSKSRGALEGGRGRGVRGGQLWDRTRVIRGKAALAQDMKGCSELVTDEPRVLGGALHGWVEIGAITTETGLCAEVATEDDWCRSC